MIRFQCGNKRRNMADNNAYISKFITALEIHPVTCDLSWAFKIAIMSMMVHIIIMLLTHL